MLVLVLSSFFFIAACIELPTVIEEAELLFLVGIGLILVLVLASLFFIVACVKLQM